ncbi:mannose-1-phosphate guanylyltransferase, partial [candidate division KSB1 bacterium]
YALIMAGGVGKRFWPMSKRSKPKQFLNLFGEKSMIRMTYDRLKSFVDKKNIFVITNEDQIDLTYKHLPDLPKTNIIGEPFGKDTAPCIALGALMAASKDPDAVMVVLPADHLITNTKEFHSVLKLGADLASTDESLITIGISPTRPETGYGYIQFDSENADKYIPETFHNKGILRVKTFAEKPNLATAKRFIESGDFLWNSGIFIWKAKTILKEIEESLPELYDSMYELQPHFNRDTFNEALLSVYRQISSISIDYGVMEKAKNVFLLRGDFGWSDVGSWAEFYKLNEKDEDGNFVSGNCVSHDSSNNLIISDKHLVAAIGVKDMVIVNSDDIFLVCPQDSTQDIKNIVDMLRRKKMDDFL